MRAISCLATSPQALVLPNNKFTAIETGRFSVSARLLLSNELLWTTLVIKQGKQANGKETIRDTQPNRVRYDD